MSKIFDPPLSYNTHRSTLKIVPVKDGIYMDSGFVYAPSANGAGFSLSQFENPLHFCPVNPEKIKTNTTFSPTDYKALGEQPCTAFPGKDLEKPDDSYYFSKGVALALRPGRLFSGKMRHFIQCLHGSRTKSGVKRNINIALAGQDGNTSTLDSMKVGEFDVTPDVILHTDTENFRYFLIKPTLYSALISEIVFDGVGEKVLSQLRGGTADFSAIELEEVEGFLFSCAKDIKNTQWVTGQFDARPHGMPLSHHWNANWDGSKAVMAPFLFTNLGFTSCLATLSISKVSHRDTQDNNQWIDNWTLSLAISQRVVDWNPRKVADIIWVGGNNIPAKDVFRAATAAPVYAWYNRDVLVVKPYTGTVSTTINTDTGWTPPPSIPGGFYGTYCGLFSTSRIRNSKSGYSKYGFGESIAEQGYIYSEEWGVSSSHSHTGAFTSVFNLADDCTGAPIPVQTVGSTASHPAKLHYARHTYQYKYSYRYFSGQTFIYISPYDPECCFTGVRQTYTDQYQPYLQTTVTTPNYKTEHYNYDNSQPNGIGSLAYTEVRKVGITPGSGGTTTSSSGAIETKTTRQASVHLKSGSYSVGVEQHNSLFQVPATGYGSTGFVGFVQQSALKNHAMYSTEDTVAANFTGCAGGETVKSHRFIGNI